MALILSGTDGVSDVDGSAATPAVRGSDTNTGLFFPAADTIAFATAGSERARIASGGNFGIGTTNPNSRLDVDANVAANVPVISLTNSANWGWATSLDFRTPLTNGGAVGLAGRVSSVYESSNNYALTLNTTASGTNAERLRIGSAGQLGIGGTNYGTSGQVLTSAGSGAAPTWTTPSAGAMTLISTQTASNSAALSWTGLSGYNNYAVVLNGIAPSTTSGFLYFQVGTGSGPTYITTSYVNNDSGLNGNGTVTNSANFTTTSIIVVGGLNGIGVRSTSSVSGRVSFFNMTNSLLTAAEYAASYQDQSSNLFTLGFGNGNTTNTTVKTAIRLFWASGNIASGTASLYGITS
jgi:hypothetical protein